MCIWCIMHPMQFIIRAAPPLRARIHAPRLTETAAMKDSNLKASQRARLKTALASIELLIAEVTTPTAAMNKMQLREMDRLTEARGALKSILPA